MIYILKRKKLPTYSLPCLDVVHGKYVMSMNMLCSWETLAPLVHDWVNVRNVHKVSLATLTKQTCGKKKLPCQATVLDVEMPAFLPNGGINKKQLIYHLYQTCLVQRMYNCCRNKAYMKTWKKGGKKSFVLPL